MHLGSDLGEYYRNFHLGKDIVFLYANRLLIQVASGMLTVFTSVFFYENFNQSFTQVALLFALAYGSYALLAPLGARLINYFCLKRLLIASIFFLPLTLLALTLWDTYPMLSLTLYIAFGLTYRTLYWMPYHVDFAKFTVREERGKQMSFLRNLSEIILSIMPFISGFLIALTGFNTAFIIAAIFTALSIIPLFFLSEVCETYSFSYARTFKELFQKENRPLLLAFVGDGVQSGIRIIVWPIFIFILLDGQYVAIGLITTFTILFLLVLRQLIGVVADRSDRKKLLKFGAFFATTGWLVKVFVESGFQIFIADTYHRFGRAVNRLSADVVMYDHAADNGHYIDEYTVLREMAINGGRAFILIFSIWIVATFGISSMFVIAAGATLLMTLLNKDVLIQ